MGLLDGLLEKVINILKKSRDISPKELAIVKDVLSKRNEFAKVVSRATIAALITSSTKGNKVDDREFRRRVDKLEKIIEVAIFNVYKRRKPFDNKMREDLEALFNEMGLNGKDAARRFIHNFDLAFGEGLREGIKEVKEELEIKEAREEKLKPSKEAKKEKEERKAEEKERERLKR